MYCKKCGNEILEGEKFCGKCGKQVDTNVSQTSNDTSTKNVIKIKFNTWLVWIIIFTFVIGLAIIMTKNSNKLIGQDKTNVNSINTNINSNITNITTEKKILSIIDEENKEFKINLDDLTNELKKIKTDEEIANREPFRSEFIVNSVSTKDIEGNTILGYGFCSKLGVLNPYYVPPFIFATNQNKNIFRISVLHRFEAEYGTNTLENSDDIYQWLYKALNNLGESELSTTIEQARTKIKNSIINKEDISSEFNIKGVHVGVSEAGKNKYGNINGYYFTYATK